jgi:hypothetical protein
MNWIEVIVFESAQLIITSREVVRIFLEQLQFYPVLAFLGWMIRLNLGVQLFYGRLCLRRSGFFQSHQLLSVDDRRIF